MITETQFVQFPSLHLDSGDTIAPVDVAYETYGDLNVSRNNAILVLHAFSGDAHAAGQTTETILEKIIPSVMATQAGAKV